VTRVFDTFLFNGELDVLECRLRELEGCDIYRHVIVEGTTTFQGTPKPLAYSDNLERFAPWAHKIRYVAMTPSADVPGKEPGDAWAREHSSRQATWAGLGDASYGDIIIHGDVDEVISPRAVAALPQVESPCKFALRWAHFAVDWLTPWLWPAPSVMRFAQLDDFTVLRERGWPVLPLSGAGWHLTWLGGPDAIIRKVNSFSHVERIDEITAGARAGKYYERGLLWAGGIPDGSVHGETQLAAAEVDDSWPRWVYERKCPASWFRPR
jgi:beta-1,4-mannosyl-glycoprotein beta-1,4-N-acetylglucosaminyltransferase